MSETAGPYDNLCLVLLETPKLVLQSASMFYISTVALEISSGLACGPHHPWWALQSSPLLPPHLQEAFLGCSHPPSLSSASGFLEQVGSEPQHSHDFYRSVPNFSIRRSLLSQGPHSPEVRGEGRAAHCWPLMPRLV